MITLLIKGDRNAALKAACRESVPVVFRQYASDGNVLAMCPDAYLDNVLVWYCQDDRPPFRPGALLHYSCKPGGRS